MCVFLLIQLQLLDNSNLISWKQKDGWMDGWIDRSISKMKSDPRQGTCGIEVLLGVLYGKRPLVPYHRVVVVAVAVVAL